MPDRILFYPCWISPGRKTGGWSWGEPCDSQSEATAIVTQRVAAGAPLGCVVKIAGGVKTPIASSVRPVSCRQVVYHWEDLWEGTE